MRALLLVDSVAVVLLILILSACNTPPGTAAPPPTPPACMHDEDCQVGPCGPCQTNAVITSASLAQECAVNPCPGARAYCTAAHTCAVR